MKPNFIFTQLLLLFFKFWNNNMSEKDLRRLANEAETLELNDLIKIKELLDAAVSKQRDYNKMMIDRIGPPYYT